MEIPTRTGTGCSQQILKDNPELYDELKLKIMEALKK